MLKIVVRKADNEPMPEGNPWRQDSPAHRPGGMEAAIAKRCGGSASDYEGYLVADKDKARFMAAKRIRWNPHEKSVEAVPYDPEEQEERRLERLQEDVEREMIRLQMEITAADTLEIPVPDKKMALDRLKAQREEIKDKKGKKPK